MIIWIVPTMIFAGVVLLYCAVVTGASFLV